jgi:hypothetical protein
MPQRQTFNCHPPKQLLLLSLLVLLSAPGTLAANSVDWDEVWNQTYDCRSSDCKWLKPIAITSAHSNISTIKAETGVNVKGVLFLHNRKASGTTFVNFIEQVQKAQGGHTKKKLQRENNFDFYQFEYDCLGEAVWSVPDRTARPYPLVLMTNFRDPIERIGSQAYYAHGFANRRINDRLEANCTGCFYYSKDTICMECRKRIEIEITQELALNDTLWMQYINGTSTFQDGYLTNYYILRLTSGIHKVGKKTHSPHTGRNYSSKMIKLCLSHSNQPCHTHNLLHKFGSLQGCPNNKKRDVTEKMLEKAKTLLADKFELYILEYLEHPCSLKYFAKLFNISSMEETAKLLAVTSNDKGIKGRIGGRRHTYRKFKYRDIMPLSVVKYLEQLNVYDFKLYEFAKTLFSERLREYGIHEGCDFKDYN